MAPNAMMAAEMAVIRLTHVADMPTPDELMRKLQEAPPPGPSGADGGGRSAPRAAPGTSIDARSGGHQPTHSGPAGPSATLATMPDPEEALARFGRFEDVVALIRHHRDVKLLVEVETGLRLARYSPGRIEFQPAPGGRARPRPTARRATSGLDRQPLGRQPGERRGCPHDRRNPRCRYQGPATTGRSASSGSGCPRSLPQGQHHCGPYAKGKGA